MSTIAVRRGGLALLVTLLAVVACYIGFARSAEAAVRPAKQRPSVTQDDPGKSHRPVIGSGVKFVRNADGSVTQTR